VDRHRTLTTSKRLYDFFKQSRSTQGMDLESRAVSFIGKHAALIWMGILALAALVVAVQERLI
jgi:hypothetical protein